MAKLSLSGLATRQTGHEAHPPVLESVLTLLGHNPVEGCWSGLYGTSATREGIKFLLQSTQRRQSVFRVICEIPGGVVTHISQPDLARLGYLNLRYADADLYEAIETTWARAACINDPHKAIESHPEYARAVADAIAPGALSLIIHPVKVASTELVLSVATILDPACVVDIRTRDRLLQIQLSQSLRTRALARV